MLNIVTILQMATAARGGLDSTRDLRVLSVYRTAWIVITRRCGI